MQPRHCLPSPTCGPGSRRCLEELGGGGDPWVRAHSQIACGNHPGPSPEQLGGPGLPCAWEGAESWGGSDLTTPASSLLIVWFLGCVCVASFCVFFNGKQD